VDGYPPEAAPPDQPDLRIRTDEHQNSDPAQIGGSVRLAEIEHRSHNVSMSGGR
jgi:hypothetical protein